MNIKIIKHQILSLTTALLIMPFALAQVGIGTTTPEGALDLETTSVGLVYPRVALTSTTVESPVTNPNGPNLAMGTVVFNTNDAATNPTDGILDVYPGIYVWNGTKWAAQFILEEYERFSQDPGCQRIPANIRTEVDGLETGSSFTPKYTGDYKVKLTTSFGAGEVKNLSGTTGNEVSTASGEGNFLFTLIGPGPTTLIDGTAMGSSGAIYCHAYSTFNENNTPDTQYDTVNLDASRTYVLSLTAGATYTFLLEILLDQTTETDFVGDAAAGTAGEHHVGHDISCTVEFIFVED